MNCSKCNFNNAFGNYCRKCGSPLNTKIAFPSKSPVTPSKDINSVSNDNASNAGQVNNYSKTGNGTFGYQHQSTLNTTNKWFKK